ncbi:hypothetical protein Leryth_022475 [Lithospermum erythrorhizon]|nr:hypothetical protein Leryth_022475 [Lithospermum erythrorhizon]
MIYKQMSCTILNFGGQQLLGNSLKVLPRSDAVWALSAEAALGRSVSSRSTSGMFGAFKAFGTFGFLLGRFHSEIELESLQESKQSESASLGSTDCESSSQEKVLDISMSPLKRPINEIAIA